MGIQKRNGMGRRAGRRHLLINLPRVNFWGDTFWMYDDRIYGSMDGQWDGWETGVHIYLIDTFSLYQVTYTKDYINKYKQISIYIYIIV